MPEDAAPQNGKWTDKKLNWDVRRLSLYIDTQVKDFFGRQQDNPHAIVLHDPESNITTVRMGFTPDPHAFNAFIGRMHRIFDRSAEHFSNSNAEGTPHILAFEPGTKQAADSFKMQGDPRLLLAQILINATDLDQLATDFPWNLLGAGRQR